ALRCACAAHEHFIGCGRLRAAAQPNRHFGSMAAPRGGSVIDRTADPQRHERPWLDRQPRFSADPTTRRPAGAGRGSKGPAMKQHLIPLVSMSLVIAACSRAPSPPSALTLATETPSVSAEFPFDLPVQLEAETAHSWPAIAWNGSHYLVAWADGRSPSGVYA